MVFEVPSDSNQSDSMILLFRLDSKFLSVLFFAPNAYSLKSVSMPCVGVISLHFRFISGLTNVLLKSFIWKKSIYEANRALESLCPIYIHT